MRLSDYLTKNKIEQQDFAKAIRVEPASVSRYATRKRIPRQAIAKRIVKASGGDVTLADIYG
jgi:hypothetical protein